MATNEVKSAQESAQRPVAELSGNLMKMLEELQRRSPMDIIKNLVGMLKTNAQNPTNKPAENVTPPNPTANQPPQVNAPKQQTTSTPKPEPKTTHTTKPENKSTHTAKPEHKERKAKKTAKKKIRVMAATHRGITR